MATKVHITDNTENVSHIDPCTEEHQACDPRVSYIISPISAVSTT